METELSTRLESIERRLTELEARVGAGNLAAAPDEASTMPASAPMVEAVPVLEAEVEHVPMAALSGEVDATEIVKACAEPKSDRWHKRAPIPKSAARSRMTREQWEKLVGTRILPIAGAVAALLGVAFFLKLGYDMGWLRFPPMWRCVLGFGVGAALVAAGEWVRRKLGALASAPVSALGLASMFAAVVAARLLYELIPPAVSLGVLVLVSALGVGVAFRARVRTVAVLSFLGAYASPFLLAVPEPEPVFMPVYLSMLLIAGVALSVRFPKLFGFMRTMNTALTALVGTLVALAQGHDHPVMIAAFLTFVWAVHHAAQAWHCTQRDRGEAVPARKTAITVGHAIVMTTWWAWLAGFVWSGGAGLGGFAGQAWHVTALGCCATLAGALVLAGHLRALVDVPETHAERYGAGLVLEAGGLLFATIALAMSGWTETLAWAGVGVVAVLAAKWIDARRLLLYGAAALGVATVRLIAVDSALAAVPNASIIATMGSALGLVFTRWMLLAWGVGGMWIVGAECARRMVGSSGKRGEPLPSARGLRAMGVRGLGIAMLAAGAGLIGAAFVHAQASMTSIIVAWLVLAAVLATTRRWIGALRPEGVAAAGMLAPACAWIVTFPFNGWIESGAPLLLHPGLLTSVAMVAAGSVVLRQLVAGMRAEAADAPGRRPVVWVYFVLGLLLMLAATSLEVWRAAPAISASASARTASLAIWWSVFAGGLALLRRFIGSLFPDRFAVGILAGAVCMWVVAFGNLNWLDATTPMLMHPGLLVLVAMLASGVAVLRSVRQGIEVGEARSQARRGVTAAFAGCGLVLMLIASSLEVARVAGMFTDDQTAQAASLSVWCGVFATTLIALGMRKRLASLRWAGLVLMGAALCKLVLYDLREITPVWRIVSFMGVGGLMLAVGVWYTSRGKRLFAEDGQSELGSG